jgi:hypothetical protein
VILLSALLLGLLAGLGRARWRHEAYRAPNLRFIWLAVLGFVPQMAIAFLPATRDLVPDWLAPVALSASLIVFLIFIWANRLLPGMPVLFAGMALNLAVMLANGGWMPISPETASHLQGSWPIDAYHVGERFGQKDILLLPQNTRLPLLADRFLLPDWTPYHVAFSLGDILIAVGVFWLLAWPEVEGEIQAE